MNIITLFTRKSVVRMLCLLGLFSASALHAEIRYSYTPDLAVSFPADKAFIEAKTVYFFSKNSGGGTVTMSCCDWREGPGSASRFKRSSADVSDGQAFTFDLTTYLPGSKRTITARTSSKSESASFFVIRPDDFTPVALTKSGAIRVRENGQVIENMEIEAGEGDSCGIDIRGYSNVLVRNVSIKHKNIGICVLESPNTTIQFAKIVSSGAPATGPHCKFGIAECNRDKANRAKADERLNIRIYKSDNTTVEYAYLEKGGAGIQNTQSDKVILNDIICFDARGPYPRGNCVQFSNSDNGSLKNFYVNNIKDISHELDNINMYEADHITISHGLLDGSFSRNGVGVIADAGSDYLTITDVDFVRTTNAAVAVWADPKTKVGKNFTVRNVRVKDTSCGARDDTKPSSGGAVLSVNPHANDPVLEDIVYWNHCNENPTYCVTKGCRKGRGGKFDIKEKNFTLKDPLRLVFPWEDSRPTITKLTVD